MLGLGLNTPRPARLELVAEEIAVPAEDIGQRMVGSLQDALRSVGLQGVGSFAILLSKLVAISVGNAEGEFLTGHGTIGNVHTRLEDVDVVAHVAKLIDIHGVLVILESSPVLTHLTRMDAQLLVKLVAHPEHVRSSSEIVLRLRVIATVQTMTEAVGDLVRQMAHKLQARLAVLEGRTPLRAVVCLLKTGCVVDVNVEGVVFLLQLQNALSQAGASLMVAAHTCVVALCACSQGEGQRGGCYKDFLHVDMIVLILFYLFFLSYFLLSVWSPFMVVLLPHIAPTFRLLTEPFFR